MGELTHPKSEAGLSRMHDPKRSALAAAAGLLWALVTLAALMVGAVLAVIFAATLAFVMLLASLLLGLAAVAWRAQHRTARSVVRGGRETRDVIEMRRAGHAWVAYDWDRPAR